MTVPASSPFMQQWQLPALGHENLQLVQVPIPEPGQGQVLVRVHAASLNYRDLLILRNGVQTTALCIDQRLPTQQKLAGKLMHGEGSAPTLALDDRGALVLRNARGDTAVFEPAALQADGR